MGLSQEIDDYIKESIDYTLRLPVSDQTLSLKLQASEEALKRLRDQYFLLVDGLKQKDEVIERTRAEACINAQALKKFVEENNKLTTERDLLLTQNSKLEKECTLYEHDREGLMDFGNEADGRAEEASRRVLELEGEVRKISEEVEFYKHNGIIEHMDDSLKAGKVVEQGLLDSVLTSLLRRDEGTPSALAFLEANSQFASCQRLLKMWNHVTPSTQTVLSLAAEISTLQRDTEHLKNNLNKAEGEVKILYDQNTVLLEENNRLLRKCHEERNHPDSSGKVTSCALAKSNKRKSCSKMSSPIKKKIEFNDLLCQERICDPAV